MSGPYVVGLDLSITATGICDIYGNCSTEGGKASLGDRRLQVITGAVEEMFTVEDGLGITRVDLVDLVVIEDLPTHAHGAGITALVHGAVRLRLLDWGVRYTLVTPATLKKFATGKGNADKTAMAMAAYKRAGVEFPDDNQCDAAWLRWAGLHALGYPAFEVPKAQSNALAKVNWPVPTIYDGGDK